MILCSFYRYVIYLFSRIVTQCIEILFCVLKIQKDTHRGERPFLSSYCDKAFGCSQNLNFHMTIHTGEKLFLYNLYAFADGLQYHHIRSTALKQLIDIPRSTTLVMVQLILLDDRLLQVNEVVAEAMRSSHQASGLQGQRG